MPAGNYRRLIAIEQYQPTARDAAGEIVADWVTVRTVWASITTKPGRNIDMGAGKTIAQQAAHVVTCRYMADLSSSIVPGKYRLRYGNLPNDFEDLTTERFETLDTATFEAMTTVPGMPPRYYQINNVSDPDERHIETVFTCTEATA